MRPISGTAVVVICLGLAAPAHATEPQPGQWKTTVKTQMPGRPPREAVHARCITPEMIKDPEATFLRNDTSPQQECKRTVRKEASGFSWSFECSGKMTMTGNGSMTFDSPTHYTGSFKIFGNAGDRAFEAVTQMEGERVGDCAN